MTILEDILLAHGLQPDHSVEFLVESPIVVNQAETQTLQDAFF
jgi:hypothetical protein